MSTTLRRAVLAYRTQLAATHSANVTRRAKEEAAAARRDGRPAPRRDVELLRAEQALKVVRTDAEDFERRHSTNRAPAPSRMLPTAEETRERNLRILDATVAGFLHRRMQIRAIVAEQSARQQNGAHPMPVGGFGRWVALRRPELVIVDLPEMHEVIPAKARSPADLEDGGPDLVSRFIADVDRRFDRALRGPR